MSDRLRGRNRRGQPCSALIRTSAVLDQGYRVIIHVHRTGKAAPGKIVFASYDNAPHYGVELETPANIWGLTDVPADWQEAA